MGYLISFRVKLIACAVFLSVVGGGLSYKAGIRDAEIVKERLTAVWPGLMEMNQVDRGILVMLAQSCNIGQVASERQAVLECLQSATSDKDLILPRSMNREQAIQRFRALLEHAQKRNL